MADGSARAPSLLQRAPNLLNRGLRRAGLELAPRREMRALRTWGGELRPDPEPAVPEGARERLGPDHPRLLELKRRYRGHPATAASVWTDDYIASDVELPLFRADSAYVWQARESWLPRRTGTGFAPSPTREINYALTAYYVRGADRLGLLERLDEDALFGNRLVRVGERAVSRDLLDSVLEIDFLDRTLGLATLDRPTVLDIGAGYGRLAHRLASGLSNLGRVVCTDAVPESTFVCEYYLDFRRVTQTAEVAPLDRVGETLREHPPEVAVNVHSFSEMSLPAIAWWLDLLADHRVRHLMIVPSWHTELLTLRLEGGFDDFGPLVRERGYRLVTREPKYRDPAVQRFGIYPTHYHLFELEG